MPRKNTKTKSTSKKTTKKAPAKRSGLQPKSALGRALVAMIKLFLDYVDDAGESSVGTHRLDQDQRRKGELVRGFLDRDGYSVEWTSLWQLEENIRRVLIKDEEEYSSDANAEASRLAAGLVERVFTLKHQRLKDLVPEAVAAVASEAKAELAQRQRSKAKKPAKASTSKGTGKGGGSKAKKPAKASTSKTGGGSKPKRGPAMAKKVSKRANGKATSTSAAKTGADDPKYQEGLKLLRSLGSHVDDQYAADELEDQLGITYDRADAIVVAAKARGDWPTLAPGALRPTTTTKAADPEKKWDPGEYKQALELIRAGTVRSVFQLADQLGISHHQAEAYYDAAVDAGVSPPLGPAAPSTSSLAAKLEGNDPLERARAYVDEQRRQGKRPSASGLKKHLGVGHAKASSLLAAVQ